MEKREKPSILIMANALPTGSYAQSYFDTLVENLTKRYIITLFTSTENAEFDHLENIKIVKKGNKVTVHFFALLYLLKRQKKQFNIVIDNKHTVPFFTPLVTNSPVLLLAHELYQPNQARLIMRMLHGIMVFAIPVFYRKATVVATSSRIAWDLSQYIGLPTTKIIRHGVTIPKKQVFTKNPRPLLSTYIEQKDIPRMFILFQTLKKLALQKKVKLTILTHAHLIPQISKRLKRYQIESLVNLHVIHSPMNLLEDLKTSWIHIAFDTYDEAMLVSLLANSVSTPTLIQKVPSSKRIVDEGKNGHMFTSSSDLYTKISILLTETNTRQKLSGSAFEWCKQYAWNKQIKKFENLIDEIIQREEKKPRRIASFLFMI